MTGVLVLKRVFDARVRGIRWVEIIGAVLVAVMVLSVYVAKAAAARESARIGELEREIAENRQRVRLLRAEISRLEQPGRLEALSRAAGLGPVDVLRQTKEAEIGAIVTAPAPPPKPAPVSAPTPAPAAPAAEAAAVAEGQR